MLTYTVNFQLQSTNRAQMRKDLIEQFMQECPGTGKDILSSRYIYYVETYGDYTVYLKRPTTKNKGFDFTVNIGELFFKKKRRYSNPSHDDIISILLKCQSNPKYNTIVKQIIQDIYDCKDIVLNTGITFEDSENKIHPLDIILLAIKWLFMEQDCAYWNYSGREMLYLEFKNRELV